MTVAALVINALFFVPDLFSSGPNADHSAALVRVHLPADDRTVPV
jgi:hypothetical protein